MCFCVKIYGQELWKITQSGRTGHELFFNFGHLKPVDFRIHNFCIPNIAKKFYKNWSLVDGDGLVDVEHDGRKVADEEGHDDQHEGQGQVSLVGENGVDCKIWNPIKI